MGRRRAALSAAGFCIVAIFVQIAAAQSPYYLNRDEPGHGCSNCAAALSQPALRGLGSDEPRYVGPGEPIVGGSWLNRPLSIGVAAGIVLGDDLIGSQVSQATDFIGGYRLGCDLNHYWGSEARLMLASIDLENQVGANDLGSNEALMVDANLLYYPWGDSRWRPFASLGLGVARFGFADPSGTEHNETMVGIPFGIGVKRRVNPWLAWRVDLTDNVALASGFADTTHNVSLMFTTELHFGGDRTYYWPWDRD